MKIRKAALRLALGVSLTLSLSSAIADTLKDIKDRGSITIGVDFTHPPYGMLNQESQRIGTDFDIATSIAHDLGVKLNVLSLTGPNRIPFLMTHKVDIVIASVAVTAERKKVIDFTRPYATQPILLVAPGKDSLKSIESLKGKAVAVARGSTADLDLTMQVKDKNVPDVQIVRYLDEATARTAVLSGQQSIAAASIADALTIKQSNPAAHYEYQFELSDDLLSIALRKDDPQLRAWLDDWIGKSLKDGTLNTIWMKYFGLPLPKSLMDPASVAATQ
jgi:polar amino acid transport system substrate-binding protein